MTRLDRAAVDVRLASLEARVPALRRACGTFDADFDQLVALLASLAVDPQYVRERASAIVRRTAQA